jgi:hypothetical protein
MMRSRITKLIAAAVIITAAAIGLTHWLRRGEPQVTIPPELAQMPVEKLLEIHLGKAQSPFAPDLVAAAVEAALHNLSARKVLDIAAKYPGRKEFFASEIAYEPPPVSKIVEASDFVVRARVHSVSLDVEDLKAAILKKELDRYGYDHFGAAVKTEAELEVLEGYPSVPAVDGDRLVLWPVLNAEALDVLEEGKEYLIALQQDGDIIWHLPDRDMEGVYSVDPNSGMVSGYRLRYGSMPLDEMWELIMDSYDAIHEAKQPSGEVLDYWLGKLQSDEHMDSWSAVDYFSIFPEPPVPPELLGDIIEDHFDALVQAYRALMAHEESLVPHRRGKEWKAVYRPIVDDIYRQLSFLTETLGLLVQVADEPTVDRMLDLYEQEASSPKSLFDKQNGYQEEAPKPLVLKIVRLVLKHPGPKRRERFVKLCFYRPLPKLLSSNMGQVIEELGRTDGEDIDRLLMDMVRSPATFGIDENYDQRGRLWEAMARRGQHDFREYLEQFLADPNESDLAKFEDYKPEYLQYAVRDAKELFNKYFATADQRASAHKEDLEALVEQYRAGETSVMDSIAELIQPEDTEYVPFLRKQADTLETDPAVMIASKFPDPCFVRVLREALEQEVTGHLLDALFACGAQEEAIEIALAELEEPGIKDGGSIGSLIRFLGTTGRASVLPVIEDFTRQDVIELYRQESWQSYDPAHLQQKAILALARLGGESAVLRMKELYESEDTDILVRITAAVSLYYLGEDTGYEFLRYFVNHTERSIPEIEARWGVDLASGYGFQVPIVTHLRSSRTDELLLERLRRGIDSADRKGYILRSSFFRDYQHELLPIAVGHLSSRDRKSRRYAHDMLKSMTFVRKLPRPDFGFDPDRFPGQQDEAIERWRSYVEDYLAHTNGSLQ